KMHHTTYLRTLEIGTVPVKEKGNTYNSNYHSRVSFPSAAIFYCLLAIGRFYFIIVQFRLFIIFSSDWRSTIDAKYKNIEIFLKNIDGLNKTLPTKKKRYSALDHETEKMHHTTYLRTLELSWGGGGGGGG
ncbi:hypothetical protein ACJX0J_034513, partial [Zea mays]